MLYRDFSSFFNEQIHMPSVLLMDPYVVTTSWNQVCLHWCLVGSPSCPGPRSHSLKPSACCRKRKGSEITYQPPAFSFTHKFKFRLCSREARGVTEPCLVDLTLACQMCCMWEESWEAPKDSTWWSCGVWLGWNTENYRRLTWRPLGRGSGPVNVYGLHTFC